MTIRGTVRSEVERMRLLSTVRGPQGVTLVIDRLRVVRGPLVGGRVRALADRCGGLRVPNSFHPTPCGDVSLW